MSGMSGISSTTSPSHPCPRPSGPQASLPPSSRTIVQLPPDHPLENPPKTRHTRAVGSIVKNWGVWPWDIIATDQQPQAWSDNLLDKLVSLSRHATLPWAHEQLQNTIAQGKPLALRDVKTVLERAIAQSPQASSRAPSAPPATTTTTTTATASIENRPSGAVANSSLVDNTATPHITRPQFPRRPSQRGIATSESAMLEAEAFTSNAQNSGHNPIPQGSPSFGSYESNNTLESNSIKLLGQPLSYQRGVKRPRSSMGTNNNPTSTEAFMAPVLTAPGPLPLDVRGTSKEVLAHFLSTPGALCHILKEECASLDKTRQRAEDVLKEVSAKLQALETKRTSLQLEVSSHEAEIADKTKRYEELLDAEKQLADAEKAVRLACRGFGIVSDASEDATRGGNNSRASQARNSLDDLETKLREKAEELEENAVHCEQVRQKARDAQSKVDEITKQWDTSCQEYVRWSQLLKNTIQEVSDIFGLLSIRPGPDDETFGPPGRTLTLVSADQLQFTEIPPLHRRRSIESSHE
ncbi:hypothetical protein CHU98_g9915 [Xylaria longipes]|nr:hypothetical protein CHU98_g9915 [Xylaria longipes]